MEKPECQRFPSCGHRHYSREPCHGEKPEEPDEKKSKVRKEIQRKATSASRSELVGLASDTGLQSEEAGILGEGRPLTQVERNRRWREKNPEKYKAQQRRAIEKRRARDES